MALAILRQLAFDGPLSSFVRSPPDILADPHYVTGMHLQFDDAFLRRISRLVEDSLRGNTFEGSEKFVEFPKNFRAERRRAIRFAVNEFRPGVETALGSVLGWRRRCDEMGYPDAARPVVLVVDYGEKAHEKWLAELPREYEGFPIRYRFSPPAEAHSAPGSRIAGTGQGTLGGMLEDTVTKQGYALTCAHVAGGTGTSIAAVDKRGKVIQAIGAVAASHMEPVSSGSCNGHARPGAGLDVSLIALDPKITAGNGCSLSVAGIAAIDQDDPVTFEGAESKSVQARIAGTTLWKTVLIDRQAHCFGDLFAIGHRLPGYVLQAVSKGGDSGSWIIEDSNQPAANRHWIGMLIAGDKQHNQSLACYSQHLFDWARHSVPNLVMPL